MTEPNYTLKQGHRISSFEVAHTDDGEFIGITFIRPDGETFIVAIPLDYQSRFLTNIREEFEECAKRATLTKKQRRLQRRGNRNGAPGF